MANVTEMPTAETEDTTPETESSTTPTPEAPKKKTGRPRKGEGPDPETRALQFFDRVAQIPREDWGNRAWMYLYIDEPICDEKQWGKLKYAKKLHQPILDLEKVKDWYGSCKGWISLNLRKQDGQNTGQNTSQIARHEFEIFDIQCPPKIPKACWTDDPANKKWAAMLPPEPKAQTEGAASLLDSIKVYKEIRDEVRDESPAPAEGDDTDKTLRTMKLAKDLFSPAAVATPPAAADPIALAVQLATTFTQMKADNPMVDFLKEQMKQQHEEMMLMRKEIADARKEPAIQPKSFVDQLMEFASDDAKLDRIKKVASVFGLGTGTGDSVVRSGRVGGYEVVRDIFSSPFGEKLGEGLGTLLGSIAKTGPPTAGSPIAAQTNGAHAPVSAESDQQRIQRIAQTITNPMISEFFDQNEPGDTFAERVYDLWPQDFLFLQKLGATTIVDLYRQHNQRLWEYLAPREAAFREFVAEFCAYVPGADEADATANADDQGIIDLEAEDSK